MFSELQLGRDDYDFISQHRNIYLRKPEKLLSDFALTNFCSMCMRLAWPANMRPNFFEISQSEKRTKYRFTREAALLRRLNKFYQNK